MLAFVAAAAIVWSGCSHQPQVRPSSVVIACADANFYVDHLHWRRWSATGAAGTGIAHRNDCKPNCAAGHFHTSTVTVRLSRVVTCVKGRREFSRIAWTGKDASSETLPCMFLKLKP